MKYTHELIHKRFIKKNGYRGEFIKFAISEYLKGNITSTDLEDLNDTYFSIDEAKKIESLLDAREMKVLENLLARPTIEVFSTGGGIYLSEKRLPNGYYFVLSTEDLNCLTMYSPNRLGEKYMADNVVFSGTLDNLAPDSLKVYDELKEALFDYIKENNIRLASVLAIG